MRRMQEARRGSKRNLPELHGQGVRENDDEICGRQVRSAQDTGATLKPLFIPLKAEYFDAFANGSKTREYRLYGPRWNERTCQVGRRVVLSRGYGKSNRLEGVVSSFERIHATKLSGLNRAAIAALFGRLDIEMAVIGIGLVANRKES